MIRDAMKSGVLRMVALICKNLKHPDICKEAVSILCTFTYRLKTNYGFSLKNVGSELRLKVLISSI